MSEVIYSSQSLHCWIPTSLLDDCPRKTCIFKDMTIISWLFVLCHSASILISTNLTCCRWWRRYFFTSLDQLLLCQPCYRYLQTLRPLKVKHILFILISTWIGWTAEFATCSCLFEALQFTPRLKDVLLRVLPILGSVRDGQRPVFANGTSFCSFLQLSVYALICTRIFLEIFEKIYVLASELIDTMFSFHLQHLSVGARLHGCI